MIWEIFRAKYQEQMAQLYGSGPKAYFLLFCRWTQVPECLSLQGRVITVASPLRCAKINVFPNQSPVHVSRCAETCSLLAAGAMNHQPRV